jgi:hypothetical protein
MPALKRNATHSGLLPRIGREKQVMMLKGK